MPCTPYSGHTNTKRAPKSELPLSWDDLDSDWAEWARDEPVVKIAV